MNSNLDAVLSGTSGSFRLPLLGLLLPVLDFRGSGFCFNKGGDSSKGSQIATSMESLCIGPQTVSSRFLNHTMFHFFHLLLIKEISLRVWGLSQD